MSDNSEHDLELAFLDRMLEEECGGARAPRLARQVTAPRTLHVLPSRRHRGGWLAAALVLLGTAVVFALATRNGGDEARPAQDPEPSPDPVVVKPEDPEHFRKLLEEAVGIEIRLMRMQQVGSSRMSLEVETAPKTVIEDPELRAWLGPLAGIGDEISVNILATPVELRLRLRGERELHLTVLGGAQPHAQIPGLGFREVSEDLLKLIADKRSDLFHRKRLQEGRPATVDEMAELPADVPGLQAPDLGVEELHRLQRFTALKRLGFVGLSARRDRLLDDDGVGVLVAMPNLQDLEALELPAGELTDAGIERLECLKSLRELGLLGGGPALTGAGFRRFRESGVQRLHLERCSGLTAEGLRTLAELPALRRLQLSVPPRESLDIVAELPSFPNLRELALHGIELVVDAPALLEPLQRTRIEVLDLSNAEDLDPDALAPLVHLPTLRVLKLTRVPVTDDALRVLGKLRQLAELDVTWTKMTKTGVDALREALPDTEVKAPVFR